MAVRCCAKHQATGDVDQAVEDHLHLVTSVVLRMGGWRGSTTWDDSVSDGSVALWRAVERFEGGRPFDPWGRQVIRRAIIDGHRHRAGRNPESAQRAAYRPVESSQGVEPIEDDFSGRVIDRLAAEQDVPRLMAEAAEADERLPGMLRLVAGGLDFRRIGRVYGLDGTRVSQLLTQIGYAPRPYRRRSA